MKEKLAIVGFCIVFAIPFGLLMLGSTIMGTVGLLRRGKAAPSIDTARVS